MKRFPLGSTLTRSGVAVLVVLTACLLFVNRGKPAGNISAAEKIGEDALARAKREGKAVMLVFSKTGVSWCERLDEYHADPDVRRAIDRHFVVARVDLVETPGGEQMYLDHGGSRGVPAFFIYGSNGLLLADSGGEGHNVGFPNSDDEVERYVAVLKSACSSLSTEDIATLRGKLEQMRVIE